ncbi:AAA family ATPase [Pseudomonas sp. TH31]|uniref:AAA family ATPase n=1 Tax=Pseudomonas sp. TH31 TaxID=2796396 RepID=UPI00191367A5|nr:AAA family ATPase [Pseudomonas sp. TH31]
MNDIVVPLAINIEVQTESYLFNGHKPSITIASGLTVLVGPNGAGKTQVLRGLKSALPNHLSNCTASKVRYLSAGRASPLERFRARSDNPHNSDDNPTYVGNASYSSHWYNYESLTGDYLVLEQRADLRLKVQARLQAFLSRSIQLTWGQSGLEIRIVPNNGGATYLANNEASGVLQLAPFWQLSITKKLAHY